MRAWVTPDPALHIKTAPGDYSFGGDYVPVNQFERPTDNCKVWMSDELAVEVFFDLSGRVVKASKSTVLIWDRSFFDKFRRYFGFKDFVCCRPGAWIAFKAGDHGCQRNPWSAGEGR
jgi:hypothetical protein